MTLKTSGPTYRIQDREYGCPIELGLSVISGKWKLLIVCRLRGQTLRHGALQRLLPGISQKMLTAQLRELEADGIVERTVYAVVPPQVEYRLTPVAAGLLPILDTLAQWGLAHSRREEHSEDYVASDAPERAGAQREHGR